MCLDSVTIHFVDQKGVKTTVQAPVGENILLVAHANHIDLEGACECSLACSTCHVYIDEDHFVQLPEPVEEEEDMLDLAYGLTPLYVCVHLQVMCKFAFRHTIQIMIYEFHECIHPNFCFVCVLCFDHDNRSRLGCQVIVTKDLEGMTVTLPKATRNLQVDKK